LWDPKKVREFALKLLYDAYFYNHKPKDETSIAVTELGQCLRLSYYLRKKPRISASFLSMLLGTSLHEIITRVAEEQHLMKREQLKCIELQNNIKICGRADLIDPNTNTIFEFKFVNKLPEEVYEKHKIQVCLYKEMFNARKVFVIYYAHKRLGGSAEVKIFEIDNCEPLVEKALERARQLHYYLTKGVLPKAERGIECRFCPYWYECKNNINIE